MGVLGNTEFTQVFNLGVEAQENTAVTCDKQFADMKVTPGWKRTGMAIVPSGSLYPTIVVNGKEYTIFTVEGPIGFGSLPFFLASGGNFAAATGAGAAKKHVNTPNTSSTNTSKTFTTEWGNSSAAFRAVGAHVVGLSFKLEYEKPTFKAEMMAQKFDIGVTLNPSPTIIENVPVPAGSMDVFSASTWANLGVVMDWLDHAYVVELDLGNLYAQDWALKSTGGYGDRYQTKPDAKVKFTALEQISSGDYVGQPFNAADMRSGAANFLRARAKGPVIGAGGGIAAIPVYDQGAGYTGAPTVVITDVGGSGSGATATATVAGGKVTGIAVTAPGTGYVNPVISFTGGTPSSTAKAFAEIDSQYMLKIDMVLLIGPDAPKRSYLDGKVVLEWPLLVGKDTVSGKALRYEVVNTEIVASS